MRQNLAVPVLSLLLAVGVMLAGGCAEKAEAPTQATQIIEDVTAQEAFTLIQENQGNADFIIIDVRTPGEFADGHIENAINIDFRSETFQNDINKLDKNKTYLIYCRSGNRSGSALNVMATLNFREVYNMSVGITQWVEEGFPIVK